MWTLWQDLRYSARLLVKHPGFTLTAIGVLTLGIGVNAGIFGIINGLMIRPLAGADAPGEVVGVYSKDRTTERGYRAFSYPGFVDVRDAGGPFAQLAAHNLALGGVTENNTTRQAMIDIVSDRLLRDARRAAGPRPRLHASKKSVRARRRARSSSATSVWERSGFDRDILKQTVRLNGQDFAHRRRRAGALHRHDRDASAPSTSCRSACTMRSKAISTPTRASRFPIAAAAR